MNHNITIEEGASLLLKTAGWQILRDGNVVVAATGGAEYLDGGLTAG